MINWMNWFPWRFAVRQIARRQGFLDPITLWARLRSFAQPSEVSEPIELLRAGVLFHARGLINSRVIQHNLDWIWPYWVVRQFNPYDESFIPRAFSITHINLSHRNWTAIGYPGCEEIPIVDPRGLVMPFLDGWSLDGWLLAEDGRCLLPSRSASCRQQQQMDEGVQIITETEMDGLALTSSAWVEREARGAVCKLRLQAKPDSKAWLVFALRPYNPEGISLIHEVALSDDRKAWTVDKRQEVEFNAPAERNHVSDYRNGDVHMHLNDLSDERKGSCKLGMVTAAALFPVDGDHGGEVTAAIPLGTATSETLIPHAWSIEHSTRCELDCPEPRYQFLYDAAIYSLILHSPKDVYPGSFTYKRFWFRDAAFIIYALLCGGLTDRAKRALDQFQQRQTKQGYFRSQDGEWDSNGEVLWILQRFFALTGQPTPPEWYDAIQRGARWIMGKRLSNELDAPHAGLLPAGFSAEHLGPNDYYYWDDFWGVAGLRAAASMLAEHDEKSGNAFVQAADDFMAAVDRSLAGCAQRLGRPAMPASPYRRLDAGAIGSMSFGYPTQLCAPDEPHVLDTVEFLLNNCFVKGAFYQDMIHSGLNAYLTLHVAQNLLRADDPRYLELMDTVADLASPTGQWPEAIHPATGGGCMGDGHHVWAAAEWLIMVRNCFVREEGDGLILGSGIPQRWLDQDKPIRFGPAPTSFGAMRLSITPASDRPPRVDWKGEWHRDAPPVEIRLPGFAPVEVSGGTDSVELAKKES